MKIAVIINRCGKYDMDVAKDEVVCETRRLMALVWVASEEGFSINFEQIKSNQIKMLMPHTDPK